ncbi:D-alanyl-D-alanine endopeptidase [Ideonella sp. DXS29W]|uniref:D-alanyl-D-alanine endopeptidase n=2 Tax=Ideonella lacteola TaxID=2984193 RepID=A0ABU9BLQ6_9BURK
MVSLAVGLAFATSADAAARRPAKNASPSATSAKKAPVARSSTRAKAAAPTRTTRAVAAPRRVAAEPPRQSFGQLAGLHEADDPLDLKSGVAYVLDQETNEVLLSKNSKAVLPIASITKLMTGLLIAESGQSLDEVLTITEEDIDTEKGSSSRLRPGTQLSRGEMLHLALMSSENRAANALGRNYPGGLSAFVAAMNAKAKLLGMSDTRYVEPTGLSSQNQSSARDLALLVKTAHQVPLLRELSTSPEYQVAVGNRQLQYRTTNRLVLNPSWEIGLQKTGYITEAGQCLVMQAQLAGRKLIMVLLDSAGKYSRIGDAERIRKWLLSSPPQSAPTTSVAPAAAPLVPVTAAVQATAG